MSNYTKIEFEDIVVYIDQLRINIYNSVMLEIFPTNSPKIAVIHDLNIHYYDNIKKDAIGWIDCIFLNKKSGSRKAIFLDLHLRAKGLFNNDADFFSQIIKFTHSFIADYVKENKVKDENGEDFVMPEIVFTEKDYKLIFPN